MLKQLENYKEFEEEIMELEPIDEFTDGTVFVGDLVLIDGLTDGC